MNSVKPYIILLTAVWFFMGCEPEPSIIQNQDLIFTHSYPIGIPSYDYLDQDLNNVLVRGDSAFESGSVDTLSNQPVLAWEGLENQVMSVAIFTEPIEVVRGVIYSGDVIWKWHSGMEASDSNRISFSEGRAVEMGEIINSSVAPDPLEPGNYYWGVWSWGKSGTSILYSSRQMEFYVSN